MKTGTRLHAQALLDMLNHKEESIKTRQQGLNIAMNLLDKGEFVQEFETIQKQCS